MAEKRSWKLNREQREFLIECLACGMRDQHAANYVKEYAGVEITQQAVWAFRTRPINKKLIEERAEQVKEGIEALGLPYARKCERVASYGRFAMIEVARKRYADAAEHMHSIAEEMGHLKVNVSHGDETPSTSVLAAALSAALDRIDAAGEAVSGTPGPED